MDFDKAAERSGYKVHTTEHDEVVDVSIFLDVPSVVEAMPAIEKRVGALMSEVPSEAREADREAVATLADELGEDGVSDMAVTFVVCMGGSARGLRIEQVVASLATHAGHLEAAGFPVQILGYTTRNWKGGRSREDWLKAGKSREPGRIADLRHVVIKPLDEPLDLKRLMVLRSDPVLKENVTGEGVAWAAGMALDAGSSRAVLVHVADKLTPIDDATLSVNREGFLSDHHKEVVKEIVYDGRVSVAAVGIGVAEGEAPSFENAGAKTYRIARAVDETVSVERSLSCLSKATLAAIRAAPVLEREVVVEPATSTPRP